VWEQNALPSAQMEAVSFSETLTTRMYHNPYHNFSNIYAVLSSFLLPPQPTSQMQSLVFYPGVRTCFTPIKITGPSKVLFLVSPRRYYDTVIKNPLEQTDVAFLGGILKN
jgi:hypothetical protein